MEEMSLAELKERLMQVETQAAQELALKRERQLDKKLEKQQELAEKAETLSKIRDVASTEAKKRGDAVKAKAQEVQERKDRYRDKCVEEAAEKIEKRKQQKRAEAFKLKKELKDIAVQSSFRQANAEQMEAKAHGEQQIGLQREAGDRQSGSLHEQRRRNQINIKETNIRLTNKEDEQTKFKTMQEHVGNRISKAKLADANLKEEIKLANSTARLHQKNAEMRGREEFGHTNNTYVTKNTIIQKNTAAYTRKMAVLV